MIWQFEGTAQMVEKLIPDCFHSDDNTDTKY